MMIVCLGSLFHIPSYWLRAVLVAVFYEGYFQLKNDFFGSFFLKKEVGLQFAKV